MTELAKVSLLAGGIIGLLHLPLLLAPALARRGLAGFARHKPSAWLLVAIDLAWSAWLLNQVPLGRFDVVKDYLFILTPVAFFLIVGFMDDLLAARALGGLLVLIPAPVLNLARWHDSAWRLVLVVLAYLMVAQGVILILSPYWFRKAALRFSAGGNARVWGMAGVAIGLGLVTLGLTVY